MTNLVKEALADDMQDVTDENMQKFVRAIGKDGSYIDVFVAVKLFNLVCGRRIRIRFPLYQPFRLLCPADVAYYSAVRRQLMQAQEVAQDAPLLLDYHSHFDMLVALSTPCVFLSFFISNF